MNNTALNSINECLVFFDRLGNILFSNQAALDFAQINKPSNLTTDSWIAAYDVLNPKTLLKLSIHTYPVIKALKGIEVRNLSLLIKNRSTSQKVEVLCNTAPLRNSEKEVVGALLSFSKVYKKEISLNQNNLVTT